MAVMVAQSVELNLKYKYDHLRCSNYPADCISHHFCYNLEKINFLRGGFRAGKSYWRGRLRMVDLLVRTSWDQFLLNANTTFIFTNLKEFNCSDVSPLVRVPCYGHLCRKKCSKFYKICANVLIAICQILFDLKWAVFFHKSCCKKYIHVSYQNTKEPEHLS